MGFADHQLGTSGVEKAAGGVTRTVNVDALQSLRDSDPDEALTVGRMQHENLCTSKTKTRTCFPSNVHYYPSHFFFFLMWPCGELCSRQSHIFLGEL